MPLFKDFIRFFLLKSTAIVSFISFQSKTALYLTELRPQATEFVAYYFIMVLLLYCYS